MILITLFTDGAFLEAVIFVFEEMGKITWCFDRRNRSDKVVALMLIIKVDCAVSSVVEQITR